MNPIPKSYLTVIQTVPCAEFVEDGRSGANVEDGRSARVGHAPTCSQQTRVQIYFISGAYSVRALRRAAAKAPDATFQASEERVKLRLMFLTLAVLNCPCCNVSVVCFCRKGKIKRFFFFSPIFCCNVLPFPLLTNVEPVVGEHWGGNGVEMVS